MGLQAHVYVETGSSSFMLNLAETYATPAGRPAWRPLWDFEAWLADRPAPPGGRHVLRACNYYAYVGHAAA